MWTGSLLVAAGFSLRRTGETPVPLGKMLGGHRQLINNDEKRFSVFTKNHNP
jgi:hypothetical protein